MDRQRVVGLVLLGLIGLYFALEGRKGEVAPPASSAPSQAPPSCLARVWAATLGYAEVRLQLEGQAAHIRLAWPEGSLEVDTPRVCSEGVSAGCPFPLGFVP